MFGRRGFEQNPKCLNLKMLRHQRGQQPAFFRLVEITAADGFRIRRRSLAAATIFMAFVIFWVFLNAAILRRRLCRLDMA